MAKKAIKSNIIAEDTTKGTILGTFTGKCCDAAVVNNNDMKLDRELFEKLIKSEEYKDAMEHRYYIGFLGHPEDPNCQDFKDGCIVMTSMEIKDNDEIYGTFDLIDTPVGRVVKSFIDAGVQFGISIRGAGDVDADGKALLVDVGEMGLGLLGVLVGDVEVYVFVAARLHLVVDGAGHDVARGE